MFEFMDIITLQAAYECQKDGVLPPYLGSMIRGIIGHCIRDFYCDYPEKRCFLCSKRSQCMYVRHFSNTGGEAGAINPYTIYVYGNGKQQWKKGDVCIFYLTIFGKAAAHASIYLDALRLAEEKGWGAARLPFRLVHVMNPASHTLVYAAGRSWTRNLIPTALQVEEKTVSNAYLQFDTPVRIVSGNQLFTSLSFEILIQFLTRRIALITTACTDNEIDWDAEELVKEAGKIKVLKEDWRTCPFARYSMNQKGNRLEWDTRMGWVLYEGELSKFVPILEAGKYLHIGKGATIGFGHYEIFYDR